MGKPKHKYILVVTRLRLDRGDGFPHELETSYVSAEIKVSKKRLKQEKKLYHRWAQDFLASYDSPVVLAKTYGLAVASKSELENFHDYDWQSFDYETEGDYTDNPITSKLDYWRDESR